MGYGEINVALRKLERLQEQCGVPGGGKAKEPDVDTSDMTTLLCLRAAKSGGGSRVVSSTAVFNAILAERPEHLDILFRGFHNDLRGEGPTGDINELTRNRVPVFSEFEGRVSCSYNQRMIQNAAERSGVPLTAQEQAALDFLREVHGLVAQHGR